MTLSAGTRRGWRSRWQIPPESLSYMTAGGETGRCKRQQFNKEQLGYIQHLNVKGRIIWKYDSFGPELIKKLSLAIRGVLNVEKIGINEDKSFAKSLFAQTIWGGKTICDKHKVVHFIFTYWALLEDLLRLSLLEAEVQRTMLHETEWAYKEIHSIKAWGPE